MTNQHPETEHSFDETYKEHQEMFGHPYQELRVYFKKHEPKGTVLDVGAGQGRDALYLASLGYTVTAIDNSEVGITQMLSEAKKRDVEIEGIVADATNVKLTKKYNIILFDMLLHAFEEMQQQKLLKKYAQHVFNKGMICMIFPDDVPTDHVAPTLNTVGSWNIKDEIIIKDIPQIGEEIVDYTFVMLCVERVQ